MMRVNSDSGSGGGTFERPKVAMSPGVLARYYDLGMQVNRFDASKIQHKVCFVWEAQQRDSKGKPFQCFDTLTVSLYGESKLKTRIEALLGRALEEHEESSGVDLDDLVGMSAMLVFNPEGYIRRVDMLQDREVRVIPEHDYKEVPRYVAKILSGGAKAAAAEEQKSPIRAGTAASTDVAHIEGGEKTDNQGNPVDEVEDPSIPF